MSEPIYPQQFSSNLDLPTTTTIIVENVGEKIGKGVYTKIKIPRGTLIARFTGQVGNKITQHTLQISSQLHVHDPWFIGMLSHSCSPNSILDMQTFELWSMTDINEEQLLTVDYAVTEDVLFRQFPCHCNSNGCREWITGRKERVNEEGLAYLRNIKETQKK